MARELKIAPDYSPIDGEALGVYQLPSKQGLTSSFEVRGVPKKSAVADLDRVEEVTVEVEFRPDELGLKDELFIEYLRTFERARITVEQMTSVIRDDLMDVLGIEEVFVEVRRGPPARKRIRLGEL